MLTLVVGERTVRSDLRLDEAAKLAQVALIDGALVAVGDDVVVNGLEGGVHRGDELAAGRAGAGVLDGPTAVVSGKTSGGFWHVLFLLSQNVPKSQSKVGKSITTVRALEGNSKPG